MTSLFQVADYWISLFLFSVVLACYLVLYAFVRRTWNELPTSGLSRPNYGPYGGVVTIFTWRMGTYVVCAHIGFSLIFSWDVERHPTMARGFVSPQLLIYPLMFLFFTVCFCVNTWLAEWIAKCTVDKINLNGKEKVLIINCFRGPIVVQVAERLSTGQVYVRDPFSTSKNPGGPEWIVENCNRCNIDKDRYNIEYGDARKLEFESEFFDVVIANHASWLYSQHYWKEVAEEVARVVKPGGKLVFVHTFSCGIRKEISDCNDWNTYKVFTIPFRTNLFIGTKGPLLSFPKEKLGLPPLKPFKFRNPDDQRYWHWLLPLSLFIFSIGLQVILCFVLYAYWDAIDIPKAIPASAMNRLNNGFIGPSVAWTGYGLIECYTQMSDEYSRGAIENVGQLLGKYSIFLAVSTLMCFVWYGVWWTPSFLLDVYVAPKLGISPTWVSIMNVVVSIALLVIFYEVFIFSKNWWARRKRKKWTNREHIPLLNTHVKSEV